MFMSSVRILTERSLLPSEFYGSIYKIKGSGSVLIFQIKCVFVFHTYKINLLGKRSE